MNNKSVKYALNCTNRNEMGCIFDCKQGGGNESLGVVTVKPNEKKTQTDCTKNRSLVWLRSKTTTTTKNEKQRNIIL
jgi:hypothetical protein